jgi:hypothetical protein
MIRSLLSLVLAATHLVTCGAAPLYLCISDDGSMCIDGGPGGCECCGETNSQAHDHDACDSACVEREHAAADPASPPAGEYAVVRATPCGCEHLAISGTSAPAIVRASSAEAGKFMATAVTSTPLAMVPPRPVLAPSADIFEQPSSTLFLSTVLRSVVLRC